MLILLTIFLMTDRINELKSAQFQTVLHIIADYMAAIMLIIASSGVYQEKKWRNEIFYLSMGAILYATLSSFGYYGGIGNVYLLLIFCVLMIIWLILIFLSFGRM